MTELTGAQRRYLRGLANPMKPMVYIGKNGLSEEVLSAIDAALQAHELIKVKFLEFKDEKPTLTQTIAKKLACEPVGTIGHVVLFYRANQDKDKRKIMLPV